MSFCEGGREGCPFQRFQLYICKRDRAKMIDGSVSTFLYSQLYPAIYSLSALKGTLRARPVGIVCYALAVPGLAKHFDHIGDGLFLCSQIAPLAYMMLQRKAPVGTKPVRGA